MSDGPDLVSLLYRADWTRLSLSADVHVSLDRDLVRSPPGDGAPPGPGSWLAFGRPWGPWPGLASLAGSLESAGPMGFPGRPSRKPGHEWAEATKVAEVLSTETGRSTLLVAPGGRYRQQGEGTLSGSDGERGWQAVLEDGNWTVTGTGGPEPPLGELLRPSWLLVGFTLEITGRVTVDGRDALTVTATPWPGLWEQAAPPGTASSDTGPSDAGPAGTGPSDAGLLNRRELVVDAELGILLRHEEMRAGKSLHVTELTGVQVRLPPRGDDGWARPPGGWDSADQSTPRDGVSWDTRGGFGEEALKLAAGLAGYGIGALIRSSGASRSRSFEQATREEAEAAMPAFEGLLPADGPPPGDELLHVIHASRDRWGQGITATLHEWVDDAAIMARVPDGVRRAGFGGLGSLVYAAGERLAGSHSVSRLYLSRSAQYRIEPVSRPGHGRVAQTTVCDGERRWRIREREAWVGPAEPPVLFPNLFDVSWLLAYPLTGGQESLTDGRRGHRLRVGPISRPAIWWFLFPDEVVVDGELGIVLRWISLAGERPGQWYELRDVVAGPLDPGLFRPDIPPGMPVTEEGSREPPRPGSSSPEPGSLPGKIASWLGRQASR
jgi:hypothetical protein